MEVFGHIFSLHPHSGTVSYTKRWKDDRNFYAFLKNLVLRRTVYYPLVKVGLIWEIIRE